MFAFTEAANEFTSYWPYGLAFVLFLWFMQYLQEKNVF
jgi:hypothetical protein